MDEEHARLVLEGTARAARRVVELKRFPEGTMREEVFRRMAQILEDVSETPLTEENVMQLVRLRRQISRFLGGPAES